MDAMNHAKPTLHPPGAFGAQEGISLVELMVSIAVGLLIVAAMIAIFINTNRTNSEMAKANSQIENGRFAIQLLENEIVHAGFWGTYVPKFDDLTQTTAPTDTPNAVPDPCLTFNTTNWTTTHKNNLVGIPTQTYEGSTFGTCSLANKKSNTDVLIARHADTCLPDAANCEADTLGKLYFQAGRCGSESYVLDCESSSVTGCSTASTLTLHSRDCTTTAEKRKYISTLYYIRDYAIVTGDGIPTLVRSQFDLSGTTLAHQSVQPLIEGIEGFRVELGIDNVSDSGASVDYSAAVNWANPSNLTSPTNRGDGVADTFIRCTTHDTAPCIAANLANTVAVKIFLLSRSKETSPGYSSNKTYCLGTPNSDGTCPTAVKLGPYSDSYKRHVFTTTIRLNNVSGRRETP